MITSSSWCQCGYKLYSAKKRASRASARVRAARGWNPAYQGSCIDPMEQSHPLNPTSKASLSILCIPIQLLIKDIGYKVLGHTELGTIWSVD